MPEQNSVKRDQPMTLCGLRHGGNGSAARRSPPDDTLEIIARIIDPGAWQNHDHAIVNAGGQSGWDPQHYALAVVGPSLRKANAIMAALDAVGLRIVPR